MLFEGADHDVIDICFEFDNASFTTKVKNNGSGFVVQDALDQAAPLPNTEVSGLRSGGPGIYLMQALMDEVDFGIKQKKYEL